MKTLNNTPLALIATLLFGIASACAGEQSNADESYVEFHQAEYSILPLYTLKPEYVSGSEYLRAQKFLTKQDKVADIRATSSIKIEDNGSNRFATKAKFNWHSANEKITLYIEGTYKAVLRTSGWHTSLTPAIGLKLAPKENWSFSLYMKETAKFASRNEPSLKSSLAFHF